MIGYSLYVTSVRVYEELSHVLQVAEVEVQDVPLEEVSTVPILLPIVPSIVKNLLFPKVTPMRLDVVPDDLLSQEVPSDDDRMIPDVPTATYVLFP